MKEYTFYKICCNDINVKYQYVGSTTNFINRKCNHKYACKSEKNKHLKVYKTINEHGGFDNWSMIKIESNFFETKLDANKHERYWFEKLNADMNMKFPQRDAVEYREVNKIKKYETNKKLYELNKEKIYEQHKKWRESNKDYSKDYYEKHKYTLLENMNKKYTCDCGGKFTHCHKKVHERTAKHIKFMIG